MSRAPIIHRLYFEKPLYEAARIMGYSGIPFADFWKQVEDRGLIGEIAQALHIDEDKAKHLLVSAAFDLTRADKREQTESRYELNGDARKAVRALLGPPPEDPLHDFWRHGPGGIVGEPEAHKWQEKYRKEQEAKAQNETQEQPKKRGRKR